MERNVEKVVKWDAVLLLPLALLNGTVLSFMLHSVDRDNTLLLTRNKTGLAGFFF